MSALDARTAYELWAPSYHNETAVSHLENMLVGALTPHGRTLDVGCGIARRLPTRDSVGADLSFNMLRHARHPAHLACADVRALPFADASFDVVWCRLVLGHLPDLSIAYHELARVARGTIIVTDFHPSAAQAGHERTFRDADNNLHSVEHYIHDLDAHASAALRSGLRIGEQRDGCVGPDVQPFYDTASRSDMYHAQIGLPLVLAVKLERV
jgi:malonyl-CoA O-methyltransferase